MKNMGFIPNKKLSDKIIGIAIEIHRSLGNGYLEKIYENALILDFKYHEIPVAQQVPLPVKYKGIILGEFFADIVVDKKIILELKAVSNLVPAHEAQLLHYLKYCDIKVGYLLNFGAESRMEFKRMVF